MTRVVPAIDPVFDQKLPDDRVVIAINTENKLIKELRRKFLKYVGDKKFATRAEFKTIMGIKSEMYADRMFGIFTSSEALDVDDFINSLTVFIDGSEKDKFHFMFKVFDTSDTGLLDAMAIKRILMISAHECNLTLTEDILNTLVAHLFQVADTNKDKYISFDEFWAAISQFPEAVASLSVNVKNLFKIDADLSKPAASPELVGWFTFMLSRHTGRTWIAGFIIVNILLVMSGFRFIGQHSPGFAIVGHGFGLAVAFSLLLCMCLIFRHMLAFLRISALSPFVNVDHHVAMHTAIGYWVVAMSYIHGIIYLGAIEYKRHDAVDNNGTIHEYWEWLFTTRVHCTSCGWLIPGSSYLTGLILLILVTLLTLLSQPCFRKKSLFWPFYLGHSLYLPIVVVGILHALSFTVVIVLPTILFGVEKVLPFYLKKRGYYKYTVKKAIALPSDVIYLVLQRPKDFEYEPGDYIFLNIKEVSYFEWHAFAFSSSPYLEDELWIHMRKNGAWTSAVHRFVDELPFGS